MTCISISHLFPSCDTNIWESIKSRVQSLFALFFQVWQPPAAALSTDLSAHTVKIGGVQNGGNTCIISVLLQEIAALPEYYDAWFTTPLKLGANETEETFAWREEFQTQLDSLVTKIRTGEVVERADIYHLTSLLLKLGWLRDEAFFWQRLLHRWAPTYFSLPESKPHKLYELLKPLFYGVESSIVLLARDEGSSHKQVLENSPYIKSPQKILWRIAEKEGNEEEINLEETFAIEKRTFALKVVHVAIEALGGNHVVAYRKEGTEWFCCDDAKIYPVKALPTKNIYAVAYVTVS